MEFLTLTNQMQAAKRCLLGAAAVAAVIFSLGFLAGRL